MTILIDIHVGDKLFESTSIGRVVVIAATNRLEDIDIAIQRRFESKVFVGPPEDADRFLLFKHFMNEIECDLTTEDYDYLCQMTRGWTGSDIEVSD